MADKISVPKKNGGSPQDDSPLSEERIVDAARHLMETSGIESVTMRKVAAALGVTAMALYHHVPDKQALVAMVADHLIGVVPDTKSEEGPWWERLRASFLTVHDEIARYPGVGLYIAGTSGFYPSGVRKFKSTMQLLIDAGFDESEAIEANYLLLAYQGGYFVMEQSTQRPSPPPTKGADEDKRHLPDFQSKAGMISYRSFVRGLDTIIAGLRAQLAAKQVLLADRPVSDDERDNVRGERSRRAR